MAAGGYEHPVAPAIALEGELVAVEGVTVDLDHEAFLAPEAVDLVTA